MLIINLDVKFIRYIDQVIEKLIRKSLGTKENIQAVLDHYKVATEQITKIMQSDWVYEFICEGSHFCFWKYCVMGNSQLSDDQKIASINKLGFVACPRINEPIV